MTVNELTPVDGLGTHPDVANLALRPNTVRQWITRGVHGKKLVGYKVGRKWYVRLGDLCSFFRQLGEIAGEKHSTALVVPKRPDSEKLRAALREGGLL